MMRRKGFEPSRPIGHMRLKHARLPFRHLRLAQNVLYYILLNKGMTKAYKRLSFYWTRG